MKLGVISSQIKIEKPVQRSTKCKIFKNCKTEAVIIRI